jgi:hypothetical protein
MRFEGEGMEFKTELSMKKIVKLALGALMLAGTAATVGTAPANAGVSVGIGIGGPGYYGPGWRCGRWHYNPYRCGYGAYYDPGYYDDAYYDGPVFLDGAWFNGPLRWRWWGGHRQFWWHNGWRIGTGWRSGGFHDRGWGGHGHFSNRPTLGHFGGGGHSSNRPTLGHFGGGHTNGGRPTLGGHMGGGHMGGGHMGGGGGHHH